MKIANYLRYARRMLGSSMRRQPTLTYVVIYPTNKCNLRCIYCSSPYKKTPEMTTEQWFSVIDQIADLGCLRVTIVGGEPLVRPDIGELIGRIRDRGMACVLASNGLLVKRRIDQLERLSTLVLSLDGVGQPNDSVRGEGVFEAVQEAIGVAKRAGIPVKINAVMSSKTIPFFDEFVDFAKRNELSYTVSIMRSGAPDLWYQASTIKGDDEEIRSTLIKTADLLKTDSSVLHSETTYRYSALWRDYSVDRLEADEVSANDPLVRLGPKCQAGRYYLSISPSGNVYPCSLTADRISGGNVLEEGLEAAWRKLHDHPCVVCNSPCLVELNYLFSLKPAVIFSFLKRHMTRFY